MNKYIVILLAGVLLSAPATATTYSAEAIEARVVDAETNQPLEGVIIVAHWELERKVGDYGHSGTDPRGPLQLKVMEAVTDYSGHFAFPAWGPLNAPFGAYLEGSDPAIVMFKPGYELYGAANLLFTRINPFIDSTRTSWINGTTVKLKKFSGDLKAYARHLEYLGDRVDFSREDRHQHCDWKEIPRMLVAVDKQERVFRKNNVYSSLPILDDLPFQDQCGSAREFLKKYLDEGNNPPDKPPVLPPKQAAPPHGMYGPPPGFIPSPLK